MDVFVRTRLFGLLIVITLVGLPITAQISAGIHPAYLIQNAKPADFHPVGGIGGADFMEDGSLVICSWGGVNAEEGKLFILTNPEAANPEEIVITEIASGIEEPMGLRVVDGDIYVMEQMALSRFAYDPVTFDLTRTVVAEGWSHSANSWSHSLEYRDGSFYTMLSSWNFYNDEYHGCWLKMEMNGDIECLAGGTRSANGTAMGPGGSMFTTDQQGNWLPANKLIQLNEGEFYGFQNTGNLLHSETETPPTAWIPYSNKISQSPSDPILVEEGLFMDQLLIGDVTNGYIRRYYLDEVGGRYQAAAFKFCDGVEGGEGIQSGVNRLRWAPTSGDLFLFGVGNHDLPGAGNWKWNAGTNDGLQKLVFQNDTTFEMLKLRARAGGLEIEFTGPVKAGMGPANFEVDTWNYIPTGDYGGPISNQATLSVSDVVYSTDNHQLFLPIEGMLETYVVHIKAVNVVSESDEELWGDEVWYTQNNFSATEPFSDPVVIATKKPAGQYYSMLDQGPHGFHLEVTDPVNYSIANIKGETVRRGKTGTGQIFISTRGLIPNMYLLKLEGMAQNTTVKFVQRGF